MTARKVRSVEEPLEVRLRRRAPYPSLEVRNPLHGTSYRVLLPESPSAASALCTCTDFARRGLGTCKHIEAGHRWLAEHPDAPALLAPPPAPPRWASIWKEVDRRQGAEPGGDPADGRRLRRVAAVLYEPATAWQYD